MPSTIKQKVIMNFGTKRESSVDGSFFVPSNENSMFKSRKMSKFVDGFNLKQSIYGMKVSWNVLI